MPPIHFLHFVSFSVEVSPTTPPTGNVFKFHFLDSELEYEEPQCRAVESCKNIQMESKKQTLLFLYYIINNKTLFIYLLERRVNPQYQSRRRPLHKKEAICWNILRNLEEMRDFEAWSVSEDEPGTLGDNGVTQTLAPHHTENNHVEQQQQVGASPGEEGSHQ